MSIIDEYLNQLQVLNQIGSAGNLKQFIPNQDTSFLRGGGLPSGSGIPTSRDGLESRMYHRRKPNIRREIESVGEEKEGAERPAVKGSEANQDEEDKEDTNVLPEDTNKSVIALSGTTGQKKSSSSPSTPSSSISEHRRVEVGAEKKQDPTSVANSQPTGADEHSDSSDNLGGLEGVPSLSEAEAKEFLSSPEKKGQSFKHGSTRSVFFIPSDSSQPIQATRKRSDWKSILPKGIKAGKIGIPVKFKKDGIDGKLFFADLISYKQWLRRRKKHSLDNK